MKLTANDLKAINWYALNYQLKPEMSSPPVMYFKNRATGEEVKKDLGGITLEYNAWKEEDQKMRARKRK